MSTLHAYALHVCWLQRMSNELIVKEQETQDTGLVDGPRLLEMLFPNPACRPSLRWLRDQQARRAIPFMNLGRLVFFNPPQVRSTMVARTLSVKGRGMALRPRGPVMG